MVLGALKKLFGGGDGGGAERTAEAVEYNGFTITPAPKPHNGQFLTAGYIRKGQGESLKEHHFIRADTHASADQAASFSISKGRQIIDEQGDRVFQ